MKCEYCGTDEQTGKMCDKCGGPLPEKDRGIWKSEPFFYNGYICYTLRESATDICEVQFWLGRELVERIRVSREFLETRILPYEDSMSLFWDLFLVAHGEKEVLEWKERNNKYPATFEVRRIENAELEWMRGLNYHEFLRAVKI